MNLKAQPVEFEFMGEKFKAMPLTLKLSRKIHAMSQKAERSEFMIEVLVDSLVEPKVTREELEECSIETLVLLTEKVIEVVKPNEKVTDPLDQTK